MVVAPYAASTARISHTGLHEAMPLAASSKDDSINALIELHVQQIMADMHHGSPEMLSLQYSANALEVANMRKKI